MDDAADYHDDASLTGYVDHLHGNCGWDCPYCEEEAEPDREEDKGDRQC